MGGKTFWITGAGTGYGRCIALALAAAGSRVFLTGRRPEKLEETRAEAGRLGIDVVRCVPVPADIASPDSVQDAVGRIAQQSDHLYGLVNNAALPQPPSGQYPLGDLDADRWNRLLATNLTGQWVVTKAALPLMSAGPALRILFMSSQAGWAFTPGFGPYNITKAATNNLGASFAAECAVRFPGKDVQINVLVPGEAYTEMNQGSSESPYSVVSMALALLSHPAGGPNGCFFHRDGRHLAFAGASPYPTPLLAGETSAVMEADSSLSAARQPGLRWLLQRLRRGP